MGSFTYKVIIDKCSNNTFRATLYRRWIYLLWLPVQDCRAVQTTVYQRYITRVILIWKNTFNILPERIIDKTNMIIK